MGFICLYFRLLGYITCNVAEMKARVKRSIGFYKHINGKGNYSL